MGNGGVDSGVGEDVEMEKTGGAVKGTVDRVGDGCKQRYGEVDNGKKGDGNENSTEETQTNKMYLELKERYKCLVYERHRVVEYQEKRQSRERQRMERNNH